ncbi:Hypothetical predicted protein [Octopus vulgaris]|uniref:Uncharacterized protein n=1 Tax=Octopus vulgaris TaxID=6645 RepID=A0AA36AR52_OCTVU|nr:Hypothetical predicted protein [Octopus vulgaris]
MTKGLFEIDEVVIEDRLELQMFLSEQPDFKYLLHNTFVKLYDYFPSVATAMIIDLASGIPKDTIHTISNSLENIFSLICTMSGPCKVPFFSVATLSGFFENKANVHDFCWIPFSRLEILKFHTKVLIFHINTVPNS